MKKPTDGQPRTSPPHRSGKGIPLLLLFVGLAGVLTILFAGDAADLFRPTNNAILLGLKKVFPGYEPPEHGLLNDHFFTEIGIAFVVAVILGATFEFFMRRREVKEHAEHIHEIENAALSSLLGYFVPPSISKEVRRVFDEQVMRSNLTVTYTFGQPAPELLALDQDLLLVTVTVEYDLINLTRKPNRHLIDHGFEPTLPLGGSFNKFLTFEIKQGIDLKIGWPDGPEKDRVHFDEGTKHCVRIIQAEVLLGPGRERGPTAEEAVHVLVKHQIVRRTCDQDSWNTWLPADGLDVKAVAAGGGPLMLDFHVERTHPGHFKEKAKLPNLCEWVLIRNPNQTESTTGAGVLPYQGFTLYWFPPVRGRECPGQEILRITSDPAVAPGPSREESSG